VSDAGRIDDAVRDFVELAAAIIEIITIAGFRELVAGPADQPVPGPKYACRADSVSIWHRARVAIGVRR
jgi:hypothetical protein